MIPRILIRVVPERTTKAVETRWEHARKLHPDWDALTYRDPIDPVEFPATADAWAACTSGAQLAGLVRLEALWNHGGIYLDSDVDVLRAMNRLRNCSAFAAWEDRHYVPDAVIGAEAGHPAIEAALHVAVARVADGAQASGPFTTTDVFVPRDDVILFPPETFYPYHYSQKDRAGEDFAALPWCYGVHRWAGSWLG